MIAGRFVLLALLLLASTTAGRAQQAVFSAKVESVRVDVLVTDNGQPIRGLGPSDFEVLDNGVPQLVELVSFEQIPLNVILALDMSASVAGERLDNLRGAGRAVLGGLRKEDQAALVTFSHVVSLGHGLTHDVGPLQDALDQAEGSGYTALMDGSYAAMMVGESDAGRSLLIVFSDGLDTSSWLSADAVLDTAKRSDIVVYGVATQSSAKPEFLHDLTAFTGGRFFEVEEAEKLGTIFLSVLEEFRHRYLVSYTPRGVSQAGWHRLDVRLRNRKATINARPGYLAGPS